MWTYTSNSCGYMLYKDGKPVRGAGTDSTSTHTRDGRIRHWRHRQADVKMFAETGRRECEKLNQ